MSSANKDSFISSFSNSMTFISFCDLITLGRTEISTLYGLCTKLIPLRVSVQLQAKGGFHIFKCFIANWSNTISCTCKLHEIQISISINKVLLEENHTDLFTYCLWLLSCCSSRTQYLQQRPSGLYKKCWWAHGLIRIVFLLLIPLNSCFFNKEIIFVYVINKDKVLSHSRLWKKKHSLCKTAVQNETSFLFFVFQRLS